MTISQKNQFVSESSFTRPAAHAGRARGDHQRRLLMALVDSNPGIHILRAAHLLGLNWNTCHYHVRRLATEGRVIVRKVQGRLCVFDRREGAVASRIAPLILREERTANLAELILNRPGLNQKTLAGILGIAQSAAHRHLMRLERAQLVRRVHQAREVTVYGTDQLAAAWTDPNRSGTHNLVPPTEGVTTEAGLLGGSSLVDVHENGAWNSNAGLFH